MSNYIVAPFLADSDIRIGGTISFQIYTSVNGSSELRQVSQVINDRRRESFSGTWMLVARWTEVAQYGGSSNVVRSRNYMKLDDIGRETHADVSNYTVSHCRATHLKECWSQMAVSRMLCSSIAVGPSTG